MTKQPVVSSFFYAKHTLLSVLSANVINIESSQSRRVVASASSSSSFSRAIRETFDVACDFRDRGFIIEESSGPERLCKDFAQLRMLIVRSEQVWRDELL